MEKEPSTEPLLILLQSKIYSVPSVSKEMDDVYADIELKKEEITTIQTQLERSVEDLKTLQNQYITMYIQTTGTFPT
jgi:hypothetical protein